jgi:hypothetical protein
VKKPICNAWCRALVAAKSDGKGGYVIKDEQTVSHLREVTIWDAGQFLAEGRFSIQLD